MHIFISHIIMYLFTNVLQTCLACSNLYVCVRVCVRVEESDLVNERHKFGRLQIPYVCMW